MINTVNYPSGSSGFTTIRELPAIDIIIHEMEATIEIGDTFKNPKFRDKRGKLRTFDRVVANPMWNQDWFTEADYHADELDRFPAGASFPGKSSAAREWVQQMHASLR